MRTEHNARPENLVFEAKNDINMDGSASSVLGGRKLAGQVAMKTFFPCALRLIVVSRDVRAYEHQDERMLVGIIRTEICRMSQPVVAELLSPP